MAMLNVPTLLLLCHALLAVGNARTMELVLLSDAVNEGAVCLDGSPPGYYIGKGSGSGANKWILHHEGGGWCYNKLDCLFRSTTGFGSSSKWPGTRELGGIFSDNATVNGEFYNWNVVYMGYCDGGSFSGFLNDPVTFSGITLYFRGKPILLALIQHLLESGVENATDVILTGCSAGGLATFLHADLVKSLLPDNINYKAMSDGGYFLNVPAVSGQNKYELSMRSVFTHHNTSGGSDSDCVAHYGAEEAWRCLFGHYTVGFIQSPIFILNSFYDSAQLSFMEFHCLPPVCDKKQMDLFRNLREEYLAQLAPALNSSAGVFLDSCAIHCQTLEDEPWSTYAVGGRTMRESFEDWYFEKSSTETQRLDCPFPCNPTCPVESFKYTCPTTESDSTPATESSTARPGAESSTARSGAESGVLFLASALILSVVADMIV